MADGLYCAGVCRLPMELLPMRRLYGGSASPTASAAAGHHGDWQNAETQNCCNVQCTLQSFSILVASVLLQGGIATQEGRPASAVRPWPIASRDGPIRAEKHGLLGPKPGLFAGHYDRHRGSTAWETDCTYVASVFPLRDVDQPGTSIQSGTRGAQGR